MSVMKHIGIPKKLSKDLILRDQNPITPDTLLKYQMISLSPGIANNFRFLIMKDGRLFYAENTHSFPEDRKVIFNAEYPKEPDRILSKAVLGEINSLLTASHFFVQPVFQMSPVRDGGLVIITAREGEKVHEVWYENVHNSLTDYLRMITPEEPTQKSFSEESVEIEEILREQKNLLNKLDQEFSDPDEKD